ncbi:hypothetical protein GQ55_5G480600 [Panicum hallii var. hallii]|uniref:Uncharacterized protein n=1 Tax=Panicum hallii var. hallii TaxID=1504633 RepID=A0A2T7DR76_9POAL|nr:hypothetical protein GQ55_5G480600 [Panicum hallii var. hallii]
MVHLAPSTTELANFHTSLRSLVQLPNSQVPGVFVSPPESNFLVSWDCKLATAQLQYFPHLIKQFPCCLVSGILFSDIIVTTPLWLAFSSSRWRLQKISLLSVQIIVTCRNNYHSVTLYCICFNP